MRILLTRAEADAGRTREKLYALGHRVIVSPVIDIAGTGAVWPPGVVDALLATSSHAFIVRMDGPAPEARRLMHLFLVGARTLEAARASDFLGPAVVAKNAASLALELGEAEHAASRAVYLAGRDRKPDLELALAKTGIALDVVEAYEARPSGSPTTEAARAFRQRTLDAVLHFSRRSAELFVEMASSHGLDVRDLAHLCLSADVATPLNEAGLTDIHVAEQPNEASLLALLPPDEEPDNPEA